MRKLRRILAVILTICLSMGSIPVPAKAATVSQVVKDGGSVYYNENGTAVSASALGQNGAVVKLSKTLQATDKENVFDVTLSVDTTLKTEENYTIYKTEYYDSAVVLTIDKSGTMYNNKMDGSRYIDVAKAKAQEFLNQYKGSAAKNEKRMLAVVTFDTDAQLVLNWTDVNTSDGLTAATNAIKNIKVADNGDSSSRQVCTNFDGGLMLTRNLLNASSVDKAHSWGIILSDGAPTVTSDNSTTVGTIKSTFWGNQGHQPAHNGGGWTHPNEVRNNLTYLQQVANKASVYMIGVGGLMDVKLFYDACYGTANGSRTSDVKNNPNAFAGISPTITVSKTESQNMSTGDWMTALANAVGGSYVSARNTTGLANAFASIINQIQSKTTPYTETIYSEGWSAVDPVGTTKTQCVDFVGFLSGNTLKSSLTKAADGDTAVHEADEIKWDLKNSNCTKNGAISSYSIKYRVRLENHAGNFVEEQAYKTNGNATFSYQTVENNQFGPAKVVSFPVPEVKGWVAELSFKKIDDAGQALNGATFALTHSASCTCGLGGAADDNIAYKTSGNTHSFTKIPSGHIYELKETAAPAGHVKDDTVYQVTVNMGTLTVDGVTKLSSWKVENQRKPGDLAVTKKVEGTAADANEEFEFTVTLDKKISGTYGDLTFKSGVATFKLKGGETKVADNLPAGTGYKVTENNAGDYVNTVVTGNEGIIPTDGRVQATFTNTKNIGQITIVADKTLEGGNLQAGQFAFELADSTGKVLQTEKNAADGTIVFDAITYKKAGTYTYTVKEVVPAEVNKFTTYDKSVYQVTVTVKTDSKGNLVATPSITKAGKAEGTISFTNYYEEYGHLSVEKVVTGTAADMDKAFAFTVTLGDTSINGTYGDMTFRNGVAVFTLKHGQTVTAEKLPSGISYTVMEDADDYANIKKENAEGTILTDATAEVSFENTKNKGVLNLNAQKELEGADLQADQFSFTLLNEDRETLQTKKNAADGTVVFDAISYDKEGVYTYYVKEEVPAEANKFTTYDRAEYKVVASVEMDAQGNLNVTTVITKGGEETDTITFTNYYQEYGHLSVEKAVTGTAADRNKAFAFTVTLSDASINGTYGDMNFVDGVATFELKNGEKMTAEKIPAGITYTVTEKADDYANTKKENAEGTILTDETAEVTFENTKNMGVLNLTAKKNLEGAELQADQFAFVLMNAAGETLQTKKNSAEGIIAFDTIEYTEAGEYEYLVKEAVPAEANKFTTYDRTEYKVQVMVELNEEGDLVVEHTVMKGEEAAEEMLFTNYYQEYGHLEVVKTVVGTAADPEDSFEFTVTLSDAEINGVYGMMNFVDGAATFELKNGEKMTAEKLPAGITYMVTEEANDYANTQKVNAEGTILTDETILVSFVNTKNNGEYVPVAFKTLEGADLQAGQFEFILTDAQGETLETVSNSEDGVVLFTAIPYSEEGVYTYYVEEAVPEEANKFMTYDNSQYKVVVTVELNEEGDLIATEEILLVTEAGEEAAEAMAFLNVYQELGDLAVTKTVSGNSASTEEEFVFTVTLSDLTITGTYGEMTFENGVATFTLKHGETVTATGLPAGITYQVSEEELDYISTSAGEEGTIVGDAQVQAAFNNHKDDEVLGDSDSPGTKDFVGYWGFKALVSAMGIMFISMWIRKKANN